MDPAMRDRQTAEGFCLGSFCLSGKEAPVENPVFVGL
jgi:hypothetical protein